MSNRQLSNGFSEAPHALNALKNEQDPRPAIRLLKNQSENLPSSDRTILLYELRSWVHSVKLDGPGRDELLGVLEDAKSYPILINSLREFLRQRDLEYHPEASKPAGQLTKWQCSEADRKVLSVCAKRIVEALKKENASVKLDQWLQSYQANSGKIDYLRAEMQKLVSHKTVEIKQVAGRLVALLSDAPAKKLVMAAPQKPNIKDASVSEQTTKGLFASLKESASSYLESATNKLDKVANRVLPTQVYNTAIQAKDWAKEKVNEATTWVAAKAEAAKTWAATKVAGGVETAKKTVDAVTEFTGQIAAKAKETLQIAIDKTKEVALAAQAKVAEFIPEPVKQFAANVKETISAEITAFANAVSPVFKTGVDAVESLTERAKFAFGFSSNSPQQTNSNLANSFSAANTPPPSKINVNGGAGTATEFPGKPDFTITVTATLPKRPAAAKPSNPPPQKDPPLPSTTVVAAVATQSLILEPVRQPPPSRPVLRPISAAPPKPPEVKNAALNATNLVLPPRISNTPQVQPSKVASPQSPPSLGEPTVKQTFVALLSPGGSASSLSGPKTVDDLFRDILAAQTVNWRANINQPSQEQLLARVKTISATSMTGLQEAMWEIQRATHLPTQLRLELEAAVRAKQLELTEWTKLDA